MQSIASIINLKTGKEPFKHKDQNLDFNLIDFWSWAQSDLLNNAQRGVLAEYIVKMDLGIKEGVRLEWDAFDLEYKNDIKIEVKSAAYLQTWKQERHSTITFNIAPSKGWNAKTNEYLSEIKRYADIYVFCLLTHQDMNTVDPLDLSQWTFYVLPTSFLNDKVPTQKKIGLNSLLKLNPIECTFGEIKSAVDNLIK